MTSARQAGSRPVPAPAEKGTPKSAHGPTSLLLHPHSVAGKSSAQHGLDGAGVFGQSRWAVGEEKGVTVREERLLGWDELFAWQQDNEYILTSHRRAQPSFREALKSTLCVHNESVNIWSHGVGALAFMTTASALYLASYSNGDENTDADVFAILTYYSSVIACFVLSFMYHTFLDHSEYVRMLTCRFDYLGIVIPLWGTTVASTHFGFRCEPALERMYSTIATLCAALCAVATLHSAFSGRTGRRVRTVVYLLLGLSSFLPIIHGIGLHGLAEHDRRMSFKYYLGLGACHGTGAMLYAARIPERWYPRRFDILGSSHQLMHMSVVCGAVCYGVGILKAFKLWHDPTDQISEPVAVCGRR